MSQDLLILVDQNDREIGQKEKEECHNGEGILHRAFSVLLFDQEGRLLLQKRSDEKRLWGGYWSNSCCSHPRVGEETTEAAHRRVVEELGCQCEIEFVYSFSYHAKFGALGSEREYCHVFLGRPTSDIAINENEIAESKFITVQQLSEEISDDNFLYSPWFKMEWETLREKHFEQLRKFTRE